MNKLCQSWLPDESDDQRHVLYHAIAQDGPYLQATIQIWMRQRCYRLGLPTSLELIQTASTEIWHDTVETALKSAHKFNLAFMPRPWLLGIATRKILRWGQIKLKEQKTVTAIADLARIHGYGQDRTQVLSEEEMLDLLYQTSSHTPQPNLSSFNELLSLVSGNDRQILRLFYADGLQGQDLAEVLGISLGAVYVRLNRARRRLHEALMHEQNAGGI